jgi:addiction module RelE/StbE family toxin
MEPVLHKSFKKQFKRLPPKVKAHFFERVDLFLDNQSHPLLNNHSVESIYPGLRSINITGDYRALYKVNNNGNIVIFMKIGTHSELYG